MRRSSLIAGAVTIAMLTGCGGQPTGRRAAAPVTPSASAMSPSRPAPTRLAVPKQVYDTSRGWSSDLVGDQFVLPGAKAVAVFPPTTYPTDGKVTVLDVTTGTTIWTSVALRPGSEGASLRGLAAAVAGQDYFVVWGTGLVGADAVSKGKPVTTIDIFPATASGTDVKPAHHVELPGEGVVRDGGGGLMVEQDGGAVTSVDPATGATKTYQPSALGPPAGCANCHDSSTRRTVTAITAHGPLLSGGQLGGFWVAGGWSSSSISPESASDNNPFIALIHDDVLLAKWHGSGAQLDTWAVLNAATGAVRAQVQCAPPKGVLPKTRRAALSSNGRYLIRGETVFDLERGTGRCYAETKSDKPVQFTGVTDSGIAFAVASPDTSDEQPVQIDIATGKVDELDTRLVPFSDVAGYGLFWDDNTKTMVAYPRIR